MGDEIRYPIELVGALYIQQGCVLRVGKPGDRVWIWENPNEPLRGGTPRAPALTLEPGTHSVTQGHAIHYARLLALDVEEFAAAIFPAWQEHVRRQEDEDG